MTYLDIDLYSQSDEPAEHWLMRKPFLKRLSLREWDDDAAAVTMSDIRCALNAWLKWLRRTGYVWMLVEEVRIRNHE